jgi:hypothetical protein
VFRGTRVPFKVLTDYLEGGGTVDQFLEQYRSVTRELARGSTSEPRSAAKMRVLIDECAPKALEKYLIDRGATSLAQSRKQAGLENRTANS